MIDDGGRHNGNGGDDHLPYHLIGASAAEVHRQAVDVINRIDNLEENFGARLDVQAELTQTLADDVAAIRRELTTIRADHGRVADAVTALKPLAEYLRKLGEHLGVDA